MGFGKEVVSLGLQRTGNWVLAWGVTSCVYDESKSIDETVREWMDKMNLNFWAKGCNNSQVKLIQIAWINQVLVCG